MYTVNYTNFFEFGVDTGDAQYEVDLPGPVSLSPLVNLSIPIRFLGALHSTLRVCMSDMYAFIYMSLLTAALLEVVNYIRGTDFIL